MLPHSTDRSFSSDVLGLQPDSEHAFLLTLCQPLRARPYACLVRENKMSVLCRPQDMVDQYLMSVCAPKAIAPVIDLTLAQQVICPSVPHQSERLEPAQALSLDVDKVTPSPAPMALGVCKSCGVRAAGTPCLPAQGPACQGLTVSRSMCHSLCQGSGRRSEPGPVGIWLRFRLFSEGVKTQSWS